MTTPTLWNDQGDTVAVIVFGNSTRDDYDKVQPLLRKLMDSPIQVHLVFVPIPERLLKELNFEYWSQWAEAARWRSVIFLPLVRVADLPWIGVGAMGTLPVFFVRAAVSGEFEIHATEILEFLAPLIKVEDLGHMSRLQCDLLRSVPKSKLGADVWLSVRGGMELLQKIPFLLDYLNHAPGRWEENGDPQAERIQLRNELFEKEVTIKRLMRNEKRYRKFFEDDITGDFLMDLNWRVLDCNRTFARIFGFPSVDYALGYDLRQFFANKHERQKVIRLFRQLSTLDYYELELIRPDGQLVNIIVNLIGIRSDDGRLVQIRGFLFDNTPRKNLEKQLRESQKMEGLGRLAGGIAHDFNNLLTVINGYAELLLADLPGDAPEANELGEILHAGLKAAELTRQLLAFSRRQVLTPQTLDINEIVGKMETMLQRLMTERINLKITMESGSACIKADKGQLEQVILNLVLNARDAMPQGGDLTVKTERVSIETSSYDSGDFILPGYYVCLQVSDTGVGMDEEVQKRIFEPFFTTKVQGKGTGLGLAMVYGIVQQSGGYLQVHSEPGKGSRFSIFFEAQNVDETFDPSIETDMPLEKGTQERVVLVEDEDMVREYTNRILSRYGYHVKAFRHGREALDFLVSNKQSWDLVLTDIVMPVMTGPELFQELALMGIDIAFLYMSGYTDDEIIRHGVSSNQVMFIHKPFKSKELLAKVKEVLDAYKR